MSSDTLIREDQFQISVVIDGVNEGLWEEKEGGEGDSEETKTSLAAMGGEVSLGGKQTRENLQLKKLFDVKGIGARAKHLDSRRGKAPCKVTQQPLDRDGNAFGESWTYTGTLKKVTLPPYDAKGNNEAYIEIEITTEGSIA